MTAVISTDQILGAPTVVRMRPRYEGSNICSWIGFKHVNYLVEEAVLEHFRLAGVGAGRLYEQYGLGLDIVELDTRIAHALHIDDAVVATVRSAPDAAGCELAASVTLRVERNGVDINAATAKVRVVLRIDDRAGPAAPAPAGLAAFTVPRIERAGAGPCPVVPLTDQLPTPGRLGRANGAADPVLAALSAGGHAFAWCWRIPYFYCHFTERLQMSGYLRLMEETVDLFLAEHGVSIRKLLDEQNWIPVVPRSKISMLAEALMEEDLYTVFTVEDVFKDLTYTARMDCYVVRDGALLPTATGTITHGYALIESRRDWALVNFDDRLLAPLRRAVRS